MKKPVFDHYFLYDEITSILKEFQASYPNLISVRSICTTPDKHEIWCASITDSATGACEDKPAFYIDANQHAGEVTGSMAAIHFITTLLWGYGSTKPSPIYSKPSASTSSPAWRWMAPNST